MKKPTEKDWVSTSYHMVNVVATVNELKKVLGEPDDDYNVGFDKVNFRWTMLTEDGETFFTVYDWKEYRCLRMNERITWHIGGKTEGDTKKAALELKAALAKG